MQMKEPEVRFVYENCTIIINASISGSKKTMENNTQLPLHSNIFSIEYYPKSDTGY